MDKDIITSIGVASSQVIDSGGNAVKSVGSGIGEFIDKSLGGISGVVVLVLVLLIIIYLILNKPNLRFNCSRLFTKNDQNEPPTIRNNIANDKRASHSHEAHEKNQSTVKRTRKNIRKHSQKRNQRY